VQTGDFVGYMLDKAVEKGVKEIIVLGHSGKLVSWQQTSLTLTTKSETHARSHRLYAAAVGVKQETINELLAANTSDEAPNSTRQAYSKHIQPHSCAGASTGE
jgi:cobalt-precorrin-5B (C1)-methyltransferase